MTRISIFSPLLFALAVSPFGCGAESEDRHDERLVFGGAIGAMRLYSSQQSVRPIDTSSIFEKRFGARDSEAYADAKRGQFRYKNESANFDAYSEAVRAKYGRSQRVEAQLAAERQRHMAAVKQHNVDYNAGRKIKANVGERISDVYFCKGGYLKMDCSVGVHGIDGLYYRRGKSGTIDSVIFSDAKTDVASLSKTVDGYYQLSPEWCLKKIDEKIAQLEAVQQQTPKIQKEIRDLKTIRRYVVGNSGNCKVCVVHLAVTANKDGHACVSFQRYDVVFDKGSKEKPTLKPGSDPEIIDMQKQETALTRRQKMLKNQYFDALLAELDDFAAKGKGNLTNEGNQRFVRNLRQAYADGKIKSVNELVDYIAKYVRDQKEARRIANTVILPTKENQMARYVKGVAVGAGVTGAFVGTLSIVGDWIANDKIDEDSVARAGVGALKAGGIVAVAALLESGAEHLDKLREANRLRTDRSPAVSKRLAHNRSPRPRMRGRLGHRAFGNRMRVGKKLTNSLRFAKLPGRVLGILYVGMDAKYLSDLNQAYAKGHVTRQEYRVKSALTGLGMAGACGGFIGAGIGGAIGFLTGGPPGAAAGAVYGFKIGEGVGAGVVFASSTGGVVVDSLFFRERRRLNELKAKLKADADGAEIRKLRQEWISSLEHERKVLMASAKDILE